MQDFYNRSDESVAIFGEFGCGASSGHEPHMGSLFVFDRTAESSSGPRAPSVMDQVPRYFGRMKRILLRRGRTREEAEDLIQDAFVKMQEYCDKGSHVQKPENFLVRTVLHLALNARRDEHRDLYCEQRVEDLTSIVDTGPTPEEALAFDECLRRMRDALNRANQRTRDVFFMHRVDGMSYAQISRQMGLSISAIEKHVASALLILAEANDVGW